MWDYVWDYARGVVGDATDARVAYSDGTARARPLTINHLNKLFQNTIMYTAQ